MIILAASVYAIQVNSPKICLSSNPISLFPIPLHYVKFAEIPILINLLRPPSRNGSRCKAIPPHMRHKSRSGFILLAFALAFNPAFSQEFILLKNINSGSAGSDPASAVVLNNTVFFVADDGIHG